MQKLLQLTVGALYLVGKGQIVYISNEEMLKPERTIVGGMPKLQPNPKNEQIVKSPALETLPGNASVDTTQIVQQIIEQLLPMFSEPEKKTKVEKAVDIAGDVADILSTFKSPRKRTKKA